MSPQKISCEKSTGGSLRQERKCQSCTQHRMMSHTGVVMNRCEQCDVNAWVSVLKQVRLVKAMDDAN